MAYPFLVVASVALMVQASQNCIDRNKRWDWHGEQCVEKWAFAVAAGAVSSCLLLLLLILQFLASATASIVKPFIAGFLALWWFVAACFLTFDHNPYKTTGNGYFACWVGAIAAMFWACACCPMIQKSANEVNRGMNASMVVPLLMCSVVELVAASLACKESKHCEQERAWAVSVGAVSVCVCLLCITFPQQVSQWGSLFLFIWWIPGVYILTFSSYDGGFQHTGNGYFATWGAMIFALGFCLSHWAPETQVGLPTTNRP
jgi:hypothetical protein